MKIREQGRLWNVWLEDDGTLDTVIGIQPVAIRHQHAGQGPEYWPSLSVRFDGEYAADWRFDSGEMSEEGIRALGREAIESYDFEEAQ